MEINFINENVSHKADLGDFISNGGTQFRQVVKHHGQYYAVDPSDGQVGRTSDTIGGLITEYRKVWNKLIVIPADRVTMTVNMEGLK